MEGEAEPALGPPVTELLPEQQTLPELQRAAAGCRACPLYARGTQTVFGEGSPRADVVLVGEQPGDREDREGHPFVGPAGGLLHGALHDAGLDDTVFYVTNVVKHFKWRPQGRRRIHQRPSRAEMDACLPWLRAELEALRPKLLVCLGATAAQALLGSGFRVTQHRGELVPTPLGLPALITVHPSSVLRAEGDEARAEALAAFTADLRRVRASLRG